MLIAKTLDALKGSFELVARDKFSVLRFLGFNPK